MLSIIQLQLFAPQLVPELVEAGARVYVVKERRQTVDNLPLG